MLFPADFGRIVISSEHREGHIVEGHMSSWLQIYHRTELLLHQKFLEIASGATLDLFNDIFLDGMILPDEVRDAARIQAMFHIFLFEMNMKTMVEPAVFGHQCCMQHFLNWCL